MNTTIEFVNPDGVLKNPAFTQATSTNKKKRVDFSLNMLFIFS